jgi:hypothetical protein
LTVKSETLDRNTQWVAERVVVPAGTTITIPHGHHLTIEAGTLVVRGHVQFDGRGDKGATGTPGAGLSVFDTEDLEAWKQSCQSEVDRGGQGGRGGSGYHGATIKVLYSALQGDTDNLDDDGLAGGAGGDGGGGGPGRLCRGPDQTPQQKYGSPGYKGADGGRGTNGSLTIKRK